MFRLKTKEPSQVDITLNVCRIKTLLYKTLTSVKTDRQRKEDPAESPTRKSKDSNTEPETIEEILENLRKGYIMLKHSPKTPEPHSKFVYLSQDNKHLCWKSVQKDDEKRFPLTSIVKIKRKGCAGGLHSKQELRQICCSILIVSTERNLELQADSQFEAQLFKYELNRAVRNSHEMNQNYLYNK